MIELISLIAATAPAVSPWIASTRRAMSSVALAVSCARSFTSPATTAKPLPASPARAASIVAFNASRFVCWAIEVITLTTWPICDDDSPRRVTMSLVDCATATACAATLVASLALTLISRIELPICWPPVATACTCEVTDVAVSADASASVEAASAELASAVAADVNSTDADPSVPALLATEAKSCRSWVDARSSAAPSRPSSSVVVRPVVRVRSPSASPSATCATELMPWSTLVRARQPTISARAMPIPKISRTVSIALPCSRTTLSRCDCTCPASPLAWRAEFACDAIDEIDVSATTALAIAVATATNTAVFILKASERPLTSAVTGVTPDMVAPSSRIVTLGGAAAAPLGLSAYPRRA